jgi:cell division protein FtsB
LVALTKAKEGVAIVHGENDILTLSRDQFATEKATLEAKNKQLHAEMHQKERLISNGGYMAFSSCLKQVEFLNPGV